jgi:nitrogen fixation NifU-like protein
VKTYTFTNASCGDTITVYLRFGADGVLKELKWQGQGCVISQASMSVLAGYVVSNHLTAESIETLQPDTVLELLGLDTIVMGREKCLQLGLKTVQKAVGAPPTTATITQSTTP